MLRDNTLTRYHLTINASTFVLSSRKDKINLARVLTTTESHKMELALPKKVVSYDHVIG